MDKTIAGIVAFLGGAIVGGGAVYLLLNKTLEQKYKTISDEEIESVKARFTVPKVEKKIEIDQPVDDPEELSKNNTNKPNLVEYVKKMKAEGYTDYMTHPPEKPTKVPAIEEPYVIKPELYGEKADYDCIELTMYADGFVADSKDEVIINTEELFGDALDQIGEWEDDAVHIVNDARKAYYEILIDPRSYTDATGKEPPEVN